MVFSGSGDWCWVCLDFLWQPFQLMQSTEQVIGVSWSYPQSKLLVLVGATHRASYWC